MPDYLEEEVSGEHKLVMAQQHLVNASWKNSTLSLLAVVLALIALLMYWVIGADATKSNFNHLEQTSQRAHTQLVCRDVATYTEQRAVSDTIVVFLVQLQNIAADSEIDIKAISDAITNLRKVQGSRDALINTCLNTPASQDGGLSSGSDG